MKSTAAESPRAVGGPLIYRVVGADGNAARISSTVNAVMVGQSANGQWLRAR